ncbi:hypothetical protein KGQ27_02665 [Patescibacteria group bacterium]|nr:hypothetical protein [Patescibacteria group bacterium]MDE1946772.1 hypothetical protein [Patescibacteria group bacterium]MDE2011096.1 hypothetical protein [Patescibacteria group bacterium]MDE2233598.1 hypothetical protein [Patescibacteria group bacterium]
MKTRLEFVKAPMVEISPVPISINFEPLRKGVERLIPSWRTIFWIAVAGFATLCVAIFAECLKNEHFLESIKY